MCFYKYMFYLVDYISNESDVTKVATVVVPDFAPLCDTTERVLEPGWG